MPSIEDRLALVERTLRLHERDRAVMRALYNTSLEDFNRRFDTVDENIATFRGEFTAFRTEVTTRLDGMQADTNALITTVGKLVAAVEKLSKP